jgi:serine/threonine protein kinase
MISSPQIDPKRINIETFSSLALLLKKLHQKLTAHLDVKPENIGFDEKTKEWYFIDYESLKTRKSLRENPKKINSIYTSDYCPESERNHATSLIAQNKVTPSKLFGFDFFEAAKKRDSLALGISFCKLISEKLNTFCQ